MMKKITMKGLILLGGLTLLLAGCAKEESALIATEDKDDKVYKIGISQLVEHKALDDARRGFEDGLVELGVNAEIDYKNAQGDIPNTMSISEKLVSDGVDLIYAIATPAAQSARQSTEDIPILFSAVTDPVKSEIVADWDNPGGNISGTSDMATTLSEQLQMFKQIDPTIKTIGIIYNTSESNSEIQIDEVKALAPEEGLEVVTVGVSNVNELPQALDSILGKVDALYNISDNLVASSVELVTSKLIEKNMISVSAEESQVSGGILITNGLSYYELGKQTAEMAKEILVNGKDPGSIAVVKAKKTETTVNMKTLKALGLDENNELFKNAVKVGE